MKPTISLLLFSLFFFIACSPPKEGKLVPFEEVCDPKYDRGRDDKNKDVVHRIAFEGYLAMPRSAMISDTMFVDVHKEPNRGGVPLRASFKIGSGKNQLEKPPKSYTEKDLKVHTKDGVVIGQNAKVRLHGDRGGDLKGNSCYITIKLVESIP